MKKDKLFDLLQNYVYGRTEIQLAEKLDLPVLGLLENHIKDGAKIVWLKCG